MWTCLGGKFPLFCSLRTHYEICSLLKRCVCTHLLTHESMIMCSFEHNFPLVHPMWRVSTKLYQLRDVTTCNFSLKRPRRSRRLATKNDWPQRPRKTLTEHEEQLSTTTDHDMTAPFRLTRTCPCATFDIVDMSERKVSIVLPTENGLWGVFTAKQRVST